MFPASSAARTTGQRHFQAQVKNTCPKICSKSAYLKHRVRSSHCPALLAYLLEQKKKTTLLQDRFIWSIGWPTSQWQSLSPPRDPVLGCVVSVAATFVRRNDQERTQGSRQHCFWAHLFFHDLISNNNSGNNMIVIIIMIMDNMNGNLYYTAKYLCVCLCLYIDTPSRWN